VWKRARRRTRNELTAMLCDVAGLSPDDAAERAAELAPLASGDTLTLVTDWVFWSQIPEPDRPPFKDFQRFSVFEGWDTEEAELLGAGTALGLDGE